MRSCVTAVLFLGVDSKPPIEDDMNDFKGPLIRLKTAAVIGMQHTKTPAVISTMLP